LSTERRKNRLGLRATLGAYDGASSQPRIDREGKVKMESKYCTGLVRGQLMSGVRTNRSLSNRKVMARLESFETSVYLLFISQNICR